MLSHEQGSPVVASATGVPRLLENAHPPINPLCRQAWAYVGDLGGCE